VSAIAPLALAFGALASLSLLVLLLASMPNGKPQQLRSIRRWMLATALVGAASLGGGVLLAVADRPGPSAVVGLLPLPFFALAVRFAGQVR
jgi:hypothetical protein